MRGIRPMMSTANPDARPHQISPALRKAKEGKPLPHLPLQRAIHRVPHVQGATATARILGYLMHNRCRNCGINAHAQVMR